MTPTPVGMRCPECARDRTRAPRPARGRSGVGGSRLSGLGGGGRGGRGMGRVGGPLTRYSVTQILIAINVIVFVAETATGTSLGGASGSQLGTLFRDGTLYGPLIHYNHEYYRLLTAGFLHDGILHIAFNMWFLYVVGPALEEAIGRVNYLAIYFASLFAGSFGSLLFQPMSPTVGASGALFGLLGALIVVAHYRGISIWRSGLGPTLVINIVFSLTVAGISIGGHLGGVVGGAICGWLYMELAERRRMVPAFLLGCAAVAVAAIIGALAVAGGTGLTPNGVSI